MPHRLIARRLKYFFISRVLRVDDTPRRIALGVAIGIFITWTPTIGFQMILTVALAWLLGANKLVGVPFVWISNPATAWFIYYPNYWVGNKILGGDWPKPDFIKGMRWNGSWVRTVQTWWTEIYRAIPPLFLGSILMGLMLGAIAYFATYYAVVKYREHRRRRRDAGARPSSACSTND